MKSWEFTHGNAKAEEQETGRPVRLKEYPKDFGNAELQDMLDELLLREFRGIRDVIPVSRYDDQITHVDRVVETVGGVRFVPDYTGTGDKREMQRKTSEFLAHPTVELHDNQGRVISDSEALKIVIPVDAVAYGRVYNRFLKDKTGRPTDYIEDANGEALRIAARAMYQIDQLLKTMKERKDSTEKIAKVEKVAGPVMKFFREQYEDLMMKKRTPAAS